MLDLAIQSCLNQTDPDLEVIVVADDDQDAADVARDFGSRDCRVSWVKTGLHLGVAYARNIGLQESVGEFVMFLDADDCIMPTKVARQIRALQERPECGWCCCDVVIQEPIGLTLASERYHYREKFTDAWIYPKLAQANFIPVMSPLVRRQVIRDHSIVFNDVVLLEDWHFWRALAKESRVCYVPESLASYIKRPNGRNSEKRPNVYAPDFKEPLRLNLGCGTPGTRSWHPMPEMHNLDASLGWKFEDGLGLYAEGSVSGISISHVAMYIPIEKFDWVFGEVARVLEPGGVVRVTEDSTLDPRSSRFGGWKGSDPAVTLTSPTLLEDVLLRAGLAVKHVGPKETNYVDGSLVQQQHGDPPDVFFVEGIKPVA